MQMKISEIKINPGRRDTQQRNVEELARSIAAVGLMNPITVTQDNTLIAGLHRLEAVKLLGWTEIECVVSEADGLQAELAEIDENFVRAGLSHRELGDLLLRRKELYEALHPETRQGQRNGQTAKNANFSLLETKSFAQDTADKLGVSKRTVEQLVQTARDLTPEAKKTIRDAGDKITKGAALKISRLPPDQQEEAAAILTIAPPTPKRQGVKDGEAALREFMALCSRYVSGIESLHHRADIFAGMSISQFDALGDSAYSVTTAIKEVYSILLDMALHSEVAQTDQQGRRYLEFFNKTVAELIDRTSSTVAQSLCELEAVGLVKKKLMARNAPYRIYVMLPAGEVVS